MPDYGRLLRAGEGEAMFLLGNEAVARGLLEAGVGFAATYPGTPSSEVGEVLNEIAEEAGMYFEFSVNEKVALEGAAAASFSGVRSFAFMKHVGLNVASDAFISLGYTGVRAGLVVMSADDPSMYSSQNEQDNRHYAELAWAPLVEPSNPQEAKDFLVWAFDLSERRGTPVLFRTTTRVSHMRGIVRAGPRRPSSSRGSFARDPWRFSLLPAVARRLKGELMRRYGDLRMEAESSPLNRVLGSGSEVGAITSGAAYNSLMDALQLLGLEMDVLKLGMSNPFPEGLVAGFLEGHRTVFVVEELDPFLEVRTRALAQMRGLGVRIVGKMDGYFPLGYEYTPDVVAEAVASALGMRPPSPGLVELGEELPPRPPVMCPGCPHRATYYAVALALRQLKLRSVVFANDIGCYGMGFYKPFEMGDVTLCMGSSIGTANGFSQVTDQPVIAFIGDSTFFHAGLPALVNAVHNNHRMLVVVMDNGTTAMTGFEPPPNAQYGAGGRRLSPISIEEVARAIGAKYVRVVDPYDLRGTLSAIKEALGSDGVSVIVARRECALLRDAELRRRGERIPVYEVDQDKCAGCLNCVQDFSCPSFRVVEGGLVEIDPSLCDGCGVCAQRLVCPPAAIGESREGRERWGPGRRVGARARST
ncbi:MAG: indolepyruvate ferredoxin oxidoreductase subunit alpha [Nitrososphaeria archaeon]